MLMPEFNMLMPLDAGFLVRVEEETDQSAGVAEAGVVPSLVPLTSTGTPEEGMIGLTGLMTATLSDLHPAWLPHPCLLSSSSSGSSMKSMMNMMRQGGMKSLTFMPHRHMTHPMGCMALPWVRLLRVGGRMASMALTWARQHVCLAAISLSRMMLHICVADLELSLAACVRHMSNCSSCNCVAVLRPGQLGLQGLVTCLSAVVSFSGRNQSKL